MSIRNESVQSCWNCLGIILLCVFLANVPVSANHTIAPDISPDMIEQIGREGDRFSVNVTGTPPTFYYLWVKNTSAMTGEPQDQPPTIYGSETVFQDLMGGPFTIGSHLVLGGGGRTNLDDIPHTPALLRAPVQSLPEVSQTTVVPPVSHVRSPGILYSVVVCGVAACLMLVSGVIIVRRWWIRRQNPGMFFG